MHVMANHEMNTILMTIIRTAILRIRYFGQRGDAKACAVEADHVHVLCELIESPDWNVLKYYYAISRQGYLREQCADATAFEPSWEKLESLLVARFGKDQSQW
jgi:hypothetical protein